MTTPAADSVLPQPPLFFDTMCLSHFARADRLDVLRDLLVERESWTTTVVRSELAVGAGTYPPKERDLPCTGTEFETFARRHRLLPPKSE